MGEIKHPSDLQQALRKVRNGDVDAFEQVVAQFQDSLRAYMLTRAPDPESADDLAQTTFVRAFEQIEKFQPDREFGAWLFGIARNLIRQAWEQAARNRRHDEPLRAFVHDRLAQRASTTPDDRNDPSSLVRALRICIEKLPERWQEIVGLHYGKKRALEDIARKFGNKPATIGVTLYRIRNRLKECVEDRLASERIQP